MILEALGLVAGIVAFVWCWASDPFQKPRSHWQVQRIVLGDELRGVDQWLAVIPAAHARERRWLLRKRKRLSKRLATALFWLGQDVTWREVYGRTYR